MRLTMRFPATTAGSIALMALLLVGCPDDTTGDGNGTTTASEDTVAPEDDTSTTTGGDSDEGDNPDEGGDTTTTTGMDGDTDLPNVPDGKNGSPCETSEDCASAEGYLCAFGMCTEICRENGEPVPGSCSGISNASEYTGLWSCPGDLRICIPGNWTGVNAICDTTADCSAKGKIFTCSGGILFGGSRVGQGICMPFADRGAPGDACSAGADCSSLVCLGANADTGTEGTCSALCRKNNQCPSGNLCQGLAQPADEEADPPQTVSPGWIPLCVQTAGSLKYCGKQSTCDDGELCEVSVEPSTFQPQYFCETAPNAGGADVGAACAAGADCESGRCFRPNTDEGTMGFCSQTCQKSPADCGADQNCGSLLFHEGGTPADFSTSDDRYVGFCVNGAPGDFCFTASQSWCAEKLSTCEAGEEEGVGSCSAPPSDCTEGLTCDDGLACTVDTCNMASKECESTELAADTCLIGGVCYAAGDKNLENVCMFCDPGNLTGDWTPVAEATACDDGNWCNGADACDAAGACVAGAEGSACDDSLECTTDVCDEENDSCTNELDDGNCLIEGACYADQATSGECAVCDSATDASVWTAFNEGGACAGEAACFKAGACEAGACVNATEHDCDDSLDCTTDSCNTETGACDNVLDADNCLIDGVCYAEGMANAANACKTCQAALATDAWSNAAGGTGCDDGISCTGSDSCTDGACAGTLNAGACYIDSTCYIDEDPSPANGCKACKSGMATDAWSDADGVACDDELACTGDGVCGGGSCGAGAVTTGCLIDSACYAEGMANPANGCETCVAAESASAWTGCGDDPTSAAYICENNVCVPD